MNYKILSINPGSTSTKIAVYDNETPLFTESIEHDNSELAKFAGINDQLEYRAGFVLSALDAHNIDKSALAAVVGRGGMLPPVKAGGYIVDKALVELMYTDKVKAHASNLGALMANFIAAPLGIPAYIYDAVASDELYDVARITGFPELSRRSFCHVLNSKASARKASEKLGGTYDKMNFIVAHIGGGISISAHEKGRIVDIVSDDEGPFSPERAGMIALGAIVDECYSSKYTKKEFMDKMKKKSGLAGHLGTNDCRKIEEMIAAGDKKAALVYEAQAYQIAKGIGVLAPVLCGEVNAVIVTGGMAYSKYLSAEITRRVSYIAPVMIIAGENEMEALTLGALRILRGEEGFNRYE